MVLVRALSLLTAVAWLGACGGAEPAPRSVFLITLDTLRADRLSCLGYPRETSPFLDRLARDGVLFTRAFASSSTTVASHASLFTSLEPPQHRMVRNGMTLDGRVATLAGHFRSSRRHSPSGYRTGGFSSVGFMAGVAGGFEVFETESRYRPAGHVLDRAIAWLESLEAGEPFFLWLHLFDVHEWPRPRNLDDRHRRLAAALEPPAEEMARRFRERGAELEVLGQPAEILDAINRYDGQILAVDAALERFFGLAETRGWNDAALWIVTSDHGEGLGDHGYAGHGARIYNEQLHVPLIFYFGDGSLGDRRVDRPVRLVDVLPTLADLLDEPFRDQVFPIVGHSLLPLLAGRDGDYPVRYAFAQRRDADPARLQAGWESGEVFSLQSERFKYIYRTAWEDEFYDLLRDPHERDNLIYYPRRAKISMRRHLAAIQAAMSAQGHRLESGDVEPRYRDELEALGYL